MKGGGKYSAPLSNRIKYVPRLLLFAIEAGDLLVSGQ